MHPPLVKVVNFHQQEGVPGCGNAVGFIVVTGILVALFCRHEQKRAGNTTKEYETDHQVLEDKLMERIREQCEERISKLETKLEKHETKFEGEVNQCEERICKLEIEHEELKAKYEEEVK